MMESLDPVTVGGIDQHLAVIEIIAVFRTCLRDPRGRTFYYNDVTVDADAARVPVNALRQRGPVNWRRGLYVGEVTVTRKIGITPYSVSRQVSLQVD